MISIPIVNSLSTLFFLATICCLGSMNGVIIIWKINLWSSLNLLPLKIRFLADNHMQNLWCHQSLQEPLEHQLQDNPQTINDAPPYLKVGLETSPCMQWVFFLIVDTGKVLYIVHVLSGSNTQNKAHLQHLSWNISPQQLLWWYPTFFKARIIITMQIIAVIFGAFFAFLIILPTVQMFNISRQ